MSGDGAHEGLTPSRALATIIGGEGQPEQSEKRNPDEMRAWIMGAPEPPFWRDGMEHGSAEADEAYNNVVRWAAKQCLVLFLADPSTAQLDESQLYGELADANPALRAEGMTGFQWGFAVNAARFCVELPPQPNPAIIDVRLPDDDA